MILQEAQVSQQSMNQVWRVNVSNYLAMFFSLITTSFSQDHVSFKPLIIPLHAPSCRNQIFILLYGRFQQLLGGGLDQDEAYQ